MTTTPDLALLALRVYSTPLAANVDPSVRNAEFNRPAIPTGWTELEWHPDDGAGFSYGVYQNGAEIVVSYAGTNQNIDWLTNGTNAVGLSSAQTTAAAIAYLQAKQQYGSNITFTGHSLGGGLASIMAVWFDRPAVVFDEAPFELTARNLALIPYTKAVLALAGYSDNAFTGYTGVLDFYTRERQVTNYYTSEEALQLGRMLWPTVVGTDNRVEFGVDNMLTRRGDIHSQALLTAGLMSDSFRQATITVQQTLPLLMNKDFYAYPTTGDAENILINFIRSEQGTGDKLTYFANDLQKLGTNIAGLNDAAQKAIIAQGIEWYYWQGTDYAGKEFFTQTGALLQYTSAKGEGLVGALNKADLYTKPWLQAITAQYGAGSASYLAYDQWNVATGSSGATATALNAGKSQIFLGQGGADSFTGGDLDDVLFAGAGTDTLNGGGGNDNLYGGADDDTLNGGSGYDIYHIEGDDTIEDSDGLGNIKDMAGRRIAGLINKRADGSYVFEPDASIGVTGDGADLKLTLASGDSVTIKDFGTGKLGLTLNKESTTAITTNRTIIGDLAALDFDLTTAGVQTRLDDLDNIIVNPNQAAPGQDDVLTDSTGNDLILGLGGNDMINASHGGDDRLDGGAGDDVLNDAQGRLDGIADERGGNDILIGGAGNDELFGHEDKDKLYAGTEVTLDAALAAQNDPATGLRGDYLDGGMADDELFGSTGNDVLLGGRGNDLMVAGAGDDDIRGDSEADVMWAGMTWVSDPWSVTRTTTTGANGVSSYSEVYHNVSFTPTTEGGWTSTWGGAMDNVIYTGIGAQDTKGDDTILAGAGADWVYGEYGNDYIDGGAGDDVLFGQDGSDQVFGGSGNDVISGDSGATPLALPGDDFLDGGAGDDKLYGGVGNDRYEFTSDFGRDTVPDADGLGSLWVDGVQLTDGNLLKADLPNVWESADNKYRYTVVGGNLLIGRGSLAGTAMDGTITVQGLNWLRGNCKPRCQNSTGDQRRHIKKHSVYRNGYVSYSPIFHIRKPVSPGCVSNLVPPLASAERNEALQ